MQNHLEYTLRQSLPVSHEICIAGHGNKELRTPGGLPYKNDGGARRKFWKEPLKATRNSITGRGPN